ncbi:MAG TPA: HNH endonuclease family protein [Candidatus Saccharimonadales bacterium]|nr:HNH endonuclease family protein [Candidatus Saccharimonadales bacterium]
MKPIGKWRLRRSMTIVLIAAMVVGGLMAADWRQSHQTVSVPANQKLSLAMTVLSGLAVRPPASKTGYNRQQFSDGWAKVDTCTIRDKILARDMIGVYYRSPADCTVMAGTLNDPYTGKAIHFVRGPNTSAAVQIDHVVAVSDSWQTGAQQLSKSQREQLYNDPLELLAVDGPSNEQKGDGDAAAWLPPNVNYECRYVARQIAVKRKYRLWVTAAEHKAMVKVLDLCPDQVVPTVGN